MQDRLLNFLANWVDANITHAADSPLRDPGALETRFLTDAVASGVKLEEVNHDWSSVAEAIAAALQARAGPAVG